MHTSDYLCYRRRKQTVIHLPTPPENVTTVTCELQKLFHLTEGKTLEALKRAYGGLSSVCGNWNVR